MLRKTMIALLTAAALTGGLTADAFARGDVDGMGMHGGAHAFPLEAISTSPNIIDFSAVIRLLAYGPGTAICTRKAHILAPLNWRQNPPKPPKDREPGCGPKWMT
jgi:hypothetical protein